MTKSTIPGEAVDAAAKESFERANPSYEWANIEPHWKAAYVENQRAALEAAAPHLIARALRAAADELEYGNPINEWLYERADAMEVVIPDQAVEAVHIPGSSAAECPCEECRDCCATFAPNWKAAS